MSAKISLLKIYRLMGSAFIEQGNVSIAFNLPQLNNICYY